MGVRKASPQPSPVGEGEASPQPSPVGEGEQYQKQ
jgi:hypothetical protein